MLVNPLVFQPTFVLPAKSVSLAILYADNSLLKSDWIFTVLSSGSSVMPFGNLQPFGQMELFITYLSAMKSEETLDAELFSATAAVKL